MNETSLNRIRALRCSAIDGIGLLNSSRREVCAEHNERIRKLRDFELSLSIKSQQGTGEMFDIDATISPEIQRLLTDPTHSL